MVFVANSFCRACCLSHKDEDQVEELAHFGVLSQGQNWTEVWWWDGSLTCRSLWLLRFIWLLSPFVVIVKSPSPIQVISCHLWRPDEFGNLLEQECLLKVVASELIFAERHKCFLHIFNQLVSRRSCVCLLKLQATCCHLLYDKSTHNREIQLKSEMLVDPSCDLCLKLVPLWIS